MLRAVTAVQGPGACSRELRRRGIKEAGGGTYTPRIDRSAWNRLHCLRYPGRLHVLFSAPPRSCKRGHQVS